MVFSLHDALMGALGGLLIGLSAALLLLGAGRIAGISGVVAGVLAGPRQAGWSDGAAFLAGLVAAPAAYAVFAGPPAIGAPTAVPALVAAGLLVGFGTRLGSGCTSGHGVCGMSRLSPRSIAATLTFMAAAAAVVLAVRLLTGGQP